MVTSHVGESAAAAAGSAWRGRPPAGATASLVASPSFRAASVSDFRHSSSYLLVSRGGSLLSSRTYRPPRTLRRLSGRRIRPRGSGWRRPHLIGSTGTMFISASTTYCLTQLRDILRTADTMADPYDALRAEFIRQFSPNVHEQLNKLVFAPRARRPSSYTADEDPPCVPASW